MESLSFTGFNHTPHYRVSNKYHLMLLGTMVTNAISCVLCLWSSMGVPHSYGWHYHFISFKALKPLYSMLSFQGWWRQCTRNYLKAASTHCWRQRHSVTALATYAMTLFMAWMPWRHNMDLLVPAGTSTRLNWIIISILALPLCHRNTYFVSGFASNGFVKLTFKPLLCVVP
jgi:hypothetical protein